MMQFDREQKRNRPLLLLEKMMNSREVYAPENSLRMFGSGKEVKER